MQKVGIVFGAVVALVAGTAHGAPVARLSITDWHVALLIGGDPGQAVFLSSNERVNQDLVMGAYQGRALLEPDGTASASSGILAGSLAGFAFGVVTTPDAYLGASWPSAPDVYSPPSGTVTGGVLSLDLASWTVFIGSPGPLSLFNQGSYGAGAWPNLGASPVTTAYDPVTRRFSADWMVAPHNFAGDRNAWHLEGQVRLVPLPAALPLTAAGVLAFLGWARVRPPA